MNFGFTNLQLQRLAILSAAAVLPAIDAATFSPSDALNEALLTDIVQAYPTHEPSTCTGGVTSSTDIWPGTNAASDWNPAFEPFEQGMFQTSMTHTDTIGNKTWTIRIGTGGNMYSHYVPDMYGETFPPQGQPNAPWIDEVQQTVSVNKALNKMPGNAAGTCPTGVNPDDNDECKKYFLHQAGAYQTDSPYTDVPFFSPSLAKFCSGNSCTFASWGVSAHLQTPFTSPVIYINKYTNCDNGVIEHTQMIHNFANPADTRSTATNVDQTYFNVGWGGVRSSKLPIALEPRWDSNTLWYADPSSVDYVDSCPWGDDNPVDLKDGHGYTAFVEEGLRIDQTFDDTHKPWCRKPGADCSLNSATCMEPCTDAQANNGHVRLQLKIPAGETPNCQPHSVWNGLISLKCDMHDTGFGYTAPDQKSASPCSPWVDIGFYRAGTEVGVRVAHLRHWSLADPTDIRTFFAVYSTDPTEAMDMVNSVFDNTLGTSELLIEVRPTSESLATEPPNYDPSYLNAFTYVYGTGSEYATANGAIGGNSRRRLGSTVNGAGRDYTIFTVNWEGSAGGGAKLQAGETYVNRGYYFGGTLGDVKTTADALVANTYIDKVTPEQWSSRPVEIYTEGSTFVVKSAALASGTSAFCNNAAATMACSGGSTPATGRVPFFYVTCGASTYFGPNPYSLTPGSGSTFTFPGHGSILDPVRSYACEGQGASARPTWKLMGFFSPGCDSASLSASTYSEEVCTSCVDSTSWRYTVSSGTKRCTWVAAGRRCGKEGNDGVMAYEACSATCDPSCQPTAPPTDAPTTSPTTTPTMAPTLPPVTNAPTMAPTLPPLNCVNDRSWRYIGRRGNLLGCNWVSGSPTGRCNKVGRYGTLAYVACPEYCNSACFF